MAKEKISHTVTIIRSSPADSLWHCIVNEQDPYKWKKLAIEYLKTLLKKSDQPKWKIQAAHIILYDYEHPETSYTTIAQEVGCSTGKVLDWMERWNRKDIADLIPDTQSRNISVAPLLIVPAITSYVPTTMAVQQIEAIQPVNIEESFAQADNNGEIRYVKDSFENLGKSNFKDVLEISTDVNLNQPTDINPDTFSYFRISSLNFAIHNFDDEQGKSHIMVFGLPNGGNWSQALIIKGQVIVDYDGTAHISGYRYLAPKESEIGGFIIPEYQGRWDVWFNPIIHDQPVSKPSSLTACVYHDNDEITNISLDATSFHSLFPTLILPSYTEITEKNFDNIKQVLSDTFYSSDITSPQEREDSLNFLKELFYALIDTLTNPEKLANILADTAIISPGLYLCWEFIKKMKSWAEKKNDSPLNQISSKCEKLLSYFERVPKSRIAEISLGTSISADEAKLLLQLMYFVHQPNCFWHPPFLQSRKHRRKQSNKAKRRKR